MAGIGSILSIARSALHAHQVATHVASNNISNAQTPGYTRQQALLTPSYPVRAHPGWIGSGVSVADVARIRDSLLDIGFRRESAGASGFGVRRDLLGQVEAVLGEPAETGLAAGLDAFWAAWADLANNPTDVSARYAVQQRGAQVAGTLNGFDRRLGDVADSALLRFQTSVEELNGLLREVADLNQRIVGAEAGGQTAATLRDARDLALDAAARIADVRVIERADRTVAVLIGGATLVDGSDARIVEAQVEREPVTGRVLDFSLTSRGSKLAVAGGTLGGLIDTIRDITGAREQLDAMAATLVMRVNEVHREAGTEVDFFDPAGLTARTIALSVEVAGDPSRIAAGDPDVGSTDNSIALKMAAIRDEVQTFVDTDGGEVRRSFADFYRDLVSGLAFKVADADRATVAAQTLAAQAELRRESMSGVSLDEELIQLMRHQQAYAAATRLVKVADEMLQSVLNMV